MTRLRVSTRAVCPCTCSDILTNKYPELFKDARKQARRLVELQKQLLILMPSLRDELSNTKGQALLILFLQRSIQTSCRLANSLRMI